MKDQNVKWQHKADIDRLLLGLFSGNKDMADEWFSAENPAFLGMSPEEMVVSGKGAEVVTKLKEWLG